MFCYRDFQLTTRFNQQNEKSTSNPFYYFGGAGAGILFHAVGDSDQENIFSRDATKTNNPKLTNASINNAICL